MNEALIKNLLDRYQRLFPDDPIYADNLKDVEISLNVTLPQDLKAISQVYNGGMIGCIDNYSIHPTGEGGDILEKTLSLRKAVNHQPRP